MNKDVNNLTSTLKRKSGYCRLNKSILFPCYATYGLRVRPGPGDLFMYLKGRYLLEANKGQRSFPVLPQTEPTGNLPELGLVY